MCWWYLKILLIIVLSIVYNGIVIRINVKLFKFFVVKIIMIIVKGWIFKDLFIIFGVMILFLSWCVINVMI